MSVNLDQVERRLAELMTSKDIEWSGRASEGWVSENVGRLPERVVCIFGHSNVMEVHQIKRELDDGEACVLPIGNECITMFEGALALADAYRGIYQLDDEYARKPDWAPTARKLCMTEEVFDVLARDGFLSRKDAVFLSDIVMNKRSVGQRSFKERERFDQLVATTLRKAVRSSVESGTRRIRNLLEISDGENIVITRS